MIALAECGFRSDCYQYRGDIGASLLLLYDLVTRLTRFWISQGVKVLTRVAQISEGRPKNTQK